MFFINASGVVRNIRATGSRIIARFGDPTKILHVIGKTFNTYIASEHDPQYWGFDTQ